MLNEIFKQSAIMALQDVIKDARLKRNLKQEEAAKAVGVTVQTYSKWENGKTEPKASQVSKLATILGLSEREICSGELNKRFSLEDFIDYSDAMRKNNSPNTVQEAVMLWRFLDNHEGYLKALEKVYEKERNPLTKLMQSEA